MPERVGKPDTLKEGVRRGVAAPRSCTPPLDSPYRQKIAFSCLTATRTRFFALGQYRIILSADTASEVRQLLSQKRR